MFRSFIRVRYSSTDGEEYFAVAKELKDLPGYSCNTEILIDGNFYLTRAI